VGNLLALIAGDSLGIGLGEEVQYLTWLSVTSQGVLGEEGLSIDSDVEHPLGAHGESQRGDDVLIVGDEIACRAHGTAGIVSGDAVGDVDHVHDDLRWTGPSSIDMVDGLLSVTGRAK
jgi:hypothetical protein